MLEQFKPVAPKRLCVIQSHISRFEEARGITSMFRENGNPHAGGTAPWGAFNLNRFANGVQNGLKKAEGLANVHAVQNETEFVSTEARHKMSILSERLETFRNYLKQQVACIVPERIVEFFERIQIEKRQIQSTVGDGSLCDQFRYVFLKPPSVRKPRQRIEISNRPVVLFACPQFFFYQLSWRNIEANGGIAVNFASNRYVRDDGGSHPIQRTILAPVTDFAMPDLALCDLAIHLTEEFSIMHPGAQDPVVGSDKFALGVAGDLAELPVDECDGASHIRNGNDGRAVEGISNKFLGFPVW